jgi:hypothetical protein
VELILAMGFNAAGIHQKIEDPRFLFWADRLGLLVWGEIAGAFEFSPTAIRRSTEEWIAAIDRDLSHPSIVTWVPLNESWGVQHIAHEARVRSHAAGLAEFTRALDPSCPLRDGCRCACSRRGYGSGRPPHAPLERARSRTTDHAHRVRQYQLRCTDLAWRLLGILDGDHARGLRTPPARGAGYRERQVLRAIVLGTHPLEG